MSTVLEKALSRKTVLVFSLVIIFLGVVFRVYQITGSDFVFYDEGFYLNHNRKFAEFLERHPVRSFDFLLKSISAFIKICLSSGKSLWFMIVDVRFFFGGLEYWFTSRLWACLFGISTLFLTYRFAMQYYRSQWIACVSVALLAVMPSHVFYSRIGMQEAFSTFLVLAAFYFYVFPKDFSPRTFLSGMLFGAAFFSNYRLIVLPVLIACCELWDAYADRRHPNYRKFVWTVLTFLCCVFIIGDINDGQNTRIIFAWIFHQANMAEQNFSPVNFLSYPYYIFRLDNALFATAFFLSSSLVFFKKEKFFLPFVLSLIQMGIFSFASEKGARYLCVVLPFMSMTVAHFLDFLMREVKVRSLRTIILILALVMFALMVDKSHAVSLIKSDYRKATQYLTDKDPDIKFLSTQNYVQSLYTKGKDNVKPAPQRFSILLNYMGQGYQHIVVCPQAYISWTKEDVRFYPELKGYMGFLVNRVKPVAEFEHFNDVMLERFVFEHSSNLTRSIEFLRMSKEQKFGYLRIYDISQASNIILPLLIQYNSLKGGGG